jgi:hypothetical protein
MRTVVSILAVFHFGDGIDSQFMIAVAVFRKGNGLNDMVAEGDLRGPISDGDYNLPLEMRENFTQDDIDGSILYIDHKLQPGQSGGGNDNCGGEVYVQFTFNDGTVVRTLPQLGSTAYLFDIGNNGVNQDAAIAMSIPPY